MLQHVTQQQALRLQSECRGEEILHHARVRPLVAWIDPSDVKSQCAELLQKLALAATHLDQGQAFEVALDHLRHRLQVLSEPGAQALLVLVVLVVLHQLGSNGLVEDQSRLK